MERRRGGEEGNVGGVSVTGKRGGVHFDDGVRPRHRKLREEGRKGGRKWVWGCMREGGARERDRTCGERVS